MLSKHQISWFIQFIQFIRFPVDPNLTRNGLNQSFLQAIQSRKVLQTCTTLDVEDDGYWLLLLFPIRRKTGKLVLGCLSLLLLWHLNSQQGCLVCTSPTTLHHFNTTIGLLHFRSVTVNSILQLRGLHWTNVWDLQWKSSREVASRFASISLQWLEWLSTFITVVSAKNDPKKMPSQRPQHLARPSDLAQRKTDPRI